MSTKHFDLDLVKVQQVRSNRDGHWQFQNEHFSGTIYEYSVEDKNFRALNKWTFEISVPDKFHKGAYVVVRPTTQHPQKTYWAGIDRESINLARATKESYREQMYAKINLSDVYDNFSLPECLKRTQQGQQFELWKKSYCKN
jgi:hypothetical protein